MSIRSSGALLLVLVAACAAPKPAVREPAAASHAAAAAPEAVGVEAQLAAEIEPLPLVPVEAADGGFRAAIESSSAAEVSALEDATLVQTRLGEALVVCWVYPKQRELGSLMRQLMEMALSTGVTAQWVDVRADQIEGTGYVLARARYWRPPPEDQVSGDLKLAAAASAEASIACAHDWPGQYASFERALRGLLASFEVKKKTQPDPIEATIMRSVGPGRTVNLARASRVMQGKNVVSHGHSTTLRLAANGALSVSDYVVAKTFVKGTLKNGDYLSEADGEAKFWISLTRGDKNYNVAGVVAGRPVAAEFPAMGGFLDADGRALAMCKVRAGEPLRLTLVDYEPDVDPLHASTTILEKNDAAEGEVRQRVEGDASGSEASFRLDDNCRRAGGTIRMGAVSVQIERIFHEKPKS